MSNKNTVDAFMLLRIRISESNPNGEKLVRPRQWKFPAVNRMKINSVLLQLNFF
jgi:hypothetical protein